MLGGLSINNCLEGMQEVLDEPSRWGQSMQRCPADGSSEGWVTMDELRYDGEDTRIRILQRYLSTLLPAADYGSYKLTLLTSLISLPHLIVVVSLHVTLNSERFSCISVTYNTDVSWQISFIIYRKEGIYLKMIFRRPKKFVPSCIYLLIRVYLCYSITLNVSPIQYLIINDWKL